MAISLKLGRKKKLVFRANHATETDQQPEARQRRRRLWAIAAACLLLALWLAPMLVAKTPLRNTALAFTFSDLNGTVTAESASLGWFSSVQAWGVKITDQEGNPLVASGTLVSDKSLLSLLLNTADLGHLTLSEPQIELALGADSTNLEQIFAAWLPPFEDDAAGGVSLSLDITTASVNLTDTVTDAGWKVTDFVGKIHLPADETAPLEIHASGTLPHEPTPGKFELDARLSTENEASVVDAKLNATQLPVAIASAVARRFAPEWEASGLFNSQLAARGTLGGKTPDLRIEGELSATDLRCAGPAFADKALTVERLQLPLLLTLQKDRLDVKRFDLDCDLGQVSCQGTLSPANRLLNASNLAEILTECLELHGEVHGHLDLAVLADRLPRTLHLREGLRIEAGQIAFRHTSQPHESEPNHWLWDSRLEASQLHGTLGGEPLVWDAPLLITLAAARTADGARVENFYCDSDFLDLQAAGTRQQFTASASYNLDRLAGELQRFIDLGEVRMAGDGTASIEWQRQPDGSFTADARADVQSLELNRPGATPWQEKQLTVSLVGSGRMESQLPARLDRAELLLRAGGEELSARLTAPIPAVETTAVWPLQVALRGQLARWIPRLEPWLGTRQSWGLADWEIDGLADVSGVVTVRAMGADLDLDQGRGKIQNLRCWGPALFITEPNLEFTAQGKWRGTQRKLELPEATLLSTALAVEMHDVVCAVPAEGEWTLLGSADFSGDLASLQAWLQEPSTPAPWQLAGRLQGQTRLERVGETIKIQLDSVAEDFSLTPDQGTAWQEPRVQLLVQGALNSKQGSATFEKLDLTADALRLSVAGKIDELQTTRNLDLNGSIHYDLAKLSQLLKPYVGNVTATGREQHAFAMSGPLNPPATAANTDSLAWLGQLKGQAGFGWQTASVFGMQIGKSKLETTLAAGELKVAPLAFAVSEGKLHLAPRVRLTPGPAELLLPKGPLLENVRLTKELCNQGLMYIAPILAGVTQVEGKISMALDGGRIPLAIPEAGDAGGRLTVHTVQLGPTPMMQELSMVLGSQLREVSLSKESTVTFRMVNGRVYHRDLEMVFPDFVIRTEGSVGLDKSLSLVAEMPVPAKWLGDNALGTALKGQTIKVPIAGSLGQPRVDRDALNAIAADFIRKSAGSLLRGQLDTQLDKLFNPLRGGK